MNDALLFRQIKKLTESILKGSISSNLKLNKNKGILNEKINDSYLFDTNNFMRDAKYSNFTK